MNKSLRVLLIEDSEDDTLLILRELRKGGYFPVHERAESRIRNEISSLFSAMGYNPLGL